MTVRDCHARTCFHRYEYLRREGNFERSAGLQIGVDTIEVRETNTRRKHNSMRTGRGKKSCRSDTHTDHVTFPA